MSVGLWYNSFKDSFNRNKQLEFHNNIYISYVNNDSSPEIDMFKVIDYNSEELVTVVNSEDANSNCLINNKNNVKGLLYFPITIEKYIFTLIIRQENDIEIIRKYWDIIKGEDKKDFKKDISKEITKINQKEFDLINYNTPSVSNIPINFKVVYLKPIKLEYIKYKGPQVIADSRSQPFESIFKKYKENKKFEYLLNPNDNTWTVKQYNS